VLPNFLLLSLYSGAIWLAALGAGWIAAVIAIVLGVAMAIVKLAYWRHIDRSPAIATIESATGLGNIGAVRALEAPHTEENYLLREMGYAIARKHAARLRGVAAVVGLIAPIVLLVIGLIAGGVPAMTISTLAAVAALLGIYIERWLFFAEATHTVTLYYGRQDVRPALGI
jgi:DMSO reductase anchor subunit